MPPFFTQAHEAGTVSEDLVEIVQQYHRSGRAVDSLDQTLDDFSDASGFTVRIFNDSRILEYLMNEAEYII